MILPLGFLLISPHLCQSGSLVGPGAVAPYEGPREHHSYGFVSEWPAGFFVGGSSVSALNGLYVKADQDHSLPHSHHHTYINDDSSWVLGYVDTSGEGHQYVAEGGKTSEWVLVSSTGRDEFAHEGDTLIPGAGRSWIKVDRHEYASRFVVGDQVRTRTRIENIWEADAEAEVKEVQNAGSHGSPVTVRFSDGRQVNTQAWRLRRGTVQEQAIVIHDVHSNDDELPWQVVAIMDEGRMKDFLRQKREHDEKVRHSVGDLAQSLPALPLHAEEAPNSNLVIEQRAQELCDAGQSAEGLHLIDEALASSSNSYTQAALHVQKASCLRQAPDPSAALVAADLALGLFPSYNAALFQRGLALLDSSRPVEAIRMFESLLRVDPSWPALRKWLLQAHARARHQGQGPVVDGFYVGDVLETRASYDGLWNAGERAVVIGLGNCLSPLVVRIERTGSIINSQSTHFKAAFSTDALASRPVSEDHYSILGVRTDFSAEDLRRSYREASKRSHPDVGGSADTFQKVTEAHQTLGDAKRRHAYDNGEKLPQADVPLHAEIERRYFPEQMEFQPFGDPHKGRRKQEEHDQILEESRNRLRNQEL